MAGIAAGLLLVACAGGPSPPDWQSNARSALDHAAAAYLTGDSAGEARDFEVARAQIARTGRPDLVARAELMRCAAHVASLAFDLCAGYEALKSDAVAPEAAYARYLAAGALSKEEIERLPAAQQATAAALAHGGEVSLDTVQAIEDPLSRLIAIAVSFRAGRASPTMIALAADTASAQGWRRPLLAWLKVQRMLAERAGDADEARRLQRRIELAEGRG